jgi:hypothetical protein
MGFNVSDNSTKAASDIFENRIVNAHFLLFDSAGNLMIHKPFEDVTNNSIPSQELDLDLQTGTVTACFIANVPTSIVSGFTKLADMNAAVLSIDYYSGKVQDADNRQNFFVVPEFDLKGDGEAEQCIPMIGMAECNLDSGNVFDISLKRLFAKVSMNIGMGNIGLNNITHTFDLLAVHLANLPTKVKLTEPERESDWVKDASAFLQQQIEGPIDGENISNTNSYEFYFYAPEYWLNPTDDKSGNYGNQKFKPNMYDKSKYPLLIKLFGEYKGSLTAQGQGVTYDLYLGENASDNFTLKRNRHYKNYIKIKGITNSVNGTGTTLDCRVDVSELDEVEILGQTANCYIIGKIGTYLYPAYKGVWKKNWGEVPDDYKCTKGTTLKVLYQDNNSIKLDKLAFNKETCEISFDVTALDTGTGAIASNDGNVILGLAYTEGGVEKIEWSWHLWFVSGAVWGIEAFEISTDTYPNNNVMMNRNLGAKVTLAQQTTPGIALGLYYKYGRKEPFVGNAYRGGGESNKYSWIPTDSKHDKSQTDPCPPGYRVPASTVWSGNATNEHASIPLLGDAFRYWNNNTPSTLQYTDDVYYPYSGYIDDNGKSQSQGYGKRDTTYNQSFNIPAGNQSNLSTTDATNYSDNLVPTNNGTGPVKFTNVTYSYYDINNLGVALAQDKEFRYGHVEKGTDIITCSVQIGKWKRSGSLFSGYKWTADYSSSTVKTLTGSQLKSQHERAYNRLISVINGKDGSNLNLLLDGFFKTPESKSEILDISSASYGYQVRCVKE